MAIYYNLPIYKASYQLLLEVTRLLGSIPRIHRYTIGQDVHRKLMDIIVMIYRANKTYDKVTTIAQMRETLLEVQVDLRLLSDLRGISEGQYAQLIDLTAQMSKQMAGWEKSEAQRINQQPKP